MPTETVLARMRAVAERSEGRLMLSPGVTDERMDAWPVPVPAAVRALLRETGGFTLTPSRDPVDFDHPLNSATGFRREGPVGTHWIIWDDGSCNIHYVDVDPETGSWGRVFSSWEDESAKLEASDLAGWIGSHLDAVESALTELAEADEDDDLEQLFLDEFWDALPSKPKVLDIPVPQARLSPDPLVADIACGLPESARLADLRACADTGFVPFDGLPGPVMYQRFHEGTFLAAIPYEAATAPA